ncbi:MAG TPA: hypothetical protein VFQ53_02500 [Kofleriaceae bacterium]|nr:hypothetical protein [Kofleriaceae bacterium]
MIDELVDRRLRVIERMAFQVSNVNVLGGRAWRAATITDGDGPWRDGFRIRPFEYPRLQKASEPIAKMVAAIGNANIAPRGTQGVFAPLPGESNVRPWRWGVNGRRLEWNMPPRGLRLPARIAGDFKVSSLDPYFLTMRNSTRRASAIVDDMFHVGLSDTDREDFWERSWLMCDHAVSALLLDGLRFGLRRRTGNDDAFDRVLSDNEEGAVQLGPFAGALLPSYFQHLGLRADDLEIGDHTIFWNSHLYLALTAGDWRLEHSLVMDVDSDPTTGRIRLEGVHLQGHGIGELSYRRYQRGILAHVKEALAEAQRLARDAGPGPNGATIDYAGNAPGFVRWAPYEQFGSPGAWWVFVPPVDRFGRSERFNGLRSNPKVVMDLPPLRRGAGYVSPPFTGLYFPLFTPRIKHGWNGYFAKRQNDPTFKPPKLDATEVDASIIPGIFVRGVEEQNAVIEVLQPKARR